MKTKIGISIGMLAAAVYFLLAVGWQTSAVLLTGYILLMESDRWLKVSAVKALAVCLFFSVLSVCVDLVPNAMTFVDRVFKIFGGGFSVDIVNKILNLIYITIVIAQKTLLLLLGFKALKGKSFNFGAADNLIKKHMPADDSVMEEFSDGTKLCPHCGKRIPADAAFCGNCGNKVEK